MQNIFNNVPSIEDGSLESNTLSMTYHRTDSFSASRLIAITHWVDSAWVKNYNPDKPNIVIQDEDILDEYNKRVARAERNKRE